MRYSSCYIAIASMEVDRLVAFYQGLLRQSPQPWVANRYAEFHLPGLRLAIFKPQADHQPEFAQAGGCPLSLCLEVADLEAAIAHLSALGQPPPGPIITAAHGREIYGYDPDGNRLILHQPP